MLGGVGDHLEGILQVVFAGTEPACEGVGFSFYFCKGIHCVFEFSSTAFDLLVEYDLIMMMGIFQKVSTCNQGVIGLYSTALHWHWAKQQQQRFV